MTEIIALIPILVLIILLIALYTYITKKTIDFPVSPSWRVNVSRDKETITFTLYDINQTK